MGRIALVAGVIRFSDGTTGVYGGVGVGGPSQASAAEINVS